MTGTGGGAFRPHHEVAWWSSASTNVTLRLPARAQAMLVESVDLPTPPLRLATVMILAIPQHNWRHDGMTRSAVLMVWASAYINSCRSSFLLFCCPAILPFCRPGDTVEYLGSPWRGLAISAWQLRERRWQIQSISRCWLASVTLLVGSSRSFAFKAGASQRSGL